MTSQKKKQRSQPKTYQGLDYQSLQKKNKSNRAKLAKEDQRWLQQNGYKNLGWEAVISLYKKIEDLREKNELEELSLEELFLEADRIGQKYQTPEEIEQFQQSMAEEANAIADLVDQQFPQSELEVIDFSRVNPGSSVLTQRRSSARKSYRTLHI